MARPVQTLSLEALKTFNGNSQQFLYNYLGYVSEQQNYSKAAVLIGTEKTVRVLSSFPDQCTGQEEWLSVAVKRFAIIQKTSQPAFLRLSGKDKSKALLLLPLERQGKWMLQVFLTDCFDESLFQKSLNDNKLYTSLLDLYENHQVLFLRQKAIERIRHSFDSLTAINHQNDFKQMTMTLCNDLAARWQCSRVSLGWQKNKHIRVQVLSHTENFSRKMEIINDLEELMEECYDQDCEVLYPPQKNSQFIYRSAERYSQKYQQSKIISLPLRYKDEVVAVLTLERKSDQTFTMEDNEALRLSCELLSSRLYAAHQNSTWPLRFYRAVTERPFAKILSFQHAALKLITLALILVFLFLFNVVSLCCFRGLFG